MTATVYPYPTLGIAPNAWPVATIPARTLAYYEIYEDDSIGFYTAAQGTLPALNEDLVVEEAGYCAIVPMAGGYSIKATATGANAHLSAVELVVGSESIFYVKIPSVMIVEVDTTIEVYVNDLSISADCVIVEAVPDEPMMSEDNNKVEKLMAKMEIEPAKVEVAIAAEEEEDLIDIYLFVYFEEYKVEPSVEKKEERLYGFYLSEELIPEEFLWEDVKVGTIKNGEGIDYLDKDFRQDFRIEKLKKKGEVKNSGYGILSTEPEITIFVNGEKAKVSTEDYGDLFLHKIEEFLIDDHDLDQEIMKEISMVTNPKKSVVRVTVVLPEDDILDETPVVRAIKKEGEEHDEEMHPSSE